MGFPICPQEIQFLFYWRLSLIILSPFCSKYLHNYIPYERKKLKRGLFSTILCEIVLCAFVSFDFPFVYRMEKVKATRCTGVYVETNHCSCCMNMRRFSDASMESFCTRWTERYHFSIFIYILNVVKINVEGSITFATDY